MKVILIENQNKIKLDLGLIQKIARYISNKFDKDTKSELNIIFSDKKDIRQLNKKCRKIDKETDVLSFSYISDKEKMSFGDNTYTVGEIIICPEIAESNVLKQKENWSLNLEIILLIIHGILHIYDYDHEEEKEKVNMEKIQDSLMSDIRSTFNL